MTMHSATVLCSDGFPLGVTAFEAAKPSSQLVLISPANGVPARFYFKFAQWLAEQGYTSVTWDWRGLGDSAPESARQFSATMLDWAARDQVAALNWAHERYRLPIIAIGHSFGGQVYGFADYPNRFAKIILFGSGNAYWRLWPSPGRYLFRSGISIMLALTTMVGYLPGKRLGLGSDLPKGVARQWLNWCLQPDYHGQWDGHSKISAPVLSYAFSDDHYAPLASREDLLQRYGGEKTLITVDPASLGLSRVGHFGFFRSQFAETLWPAFLPHIKSGC